MPKRPLARTYRPQRFAEVLGQQAPVKALGAAAERRELAAAYIFSGTRGIGKTTIARIFAKALNCERGPAADCCDDCPPCREIAEGRSLDVLEMDAATHTGIDDVRELREAAQYPPSEAARYRVFIIDEAHQLSQAAWNGLLKILEEPPAWCVFLFCTTEPHKIPPTIESRSLHFAFKSPPAAEIRAHIASIAKKEDLEVTDEALDLLAQAAQGSVRDGLSALDQVRALAGGAIDAGTVREALGLVPEEVVREYVDALGAGDAEAALARLDRIESEGHDLRGFAAEALERVRKLALVKAVGENAPGAAGVGRGEAERFRVEQLVWLGRVLDETETRLRQGGPQRTLLDLATIRMTAMADLTPLETLAGRLAGGGAPPAANPARGARREGPAAGPPRPGGRGARAAAPPSPPPAPAGPAPAAGPAVPADGPLLDRLAAAMTNRKGRLGSYLRKAREARLDENGTLVIVFPGDGAIWKDKLEERPARELLAEAAVEVLGAVPPRIAMRAEGNTEPSPPAHARNREALDQARREPLVKALFERFDAVVVGGEADEAGAPPEAGGGPPGDGPRPGAPG